MFDKIKNELKFRQSMLVTKQVTDLLEKHDVKYTAHDQNDLCMEKKHDHRKRIIEIPRPGDYPTLYISFHADIFGKRIHAVQTMEVEHEGVAGYAISHDVFTRENFEPIKLIDGIKTEWIEFENDLS